MPSLERVLTDYDLGLLRVIAELWGVELHAHTQKEAAQQLIVEVLEAGRLAEMVEALPPEARAALEEARREGWAPVARFTRVHGELRAMGPARRDREQPWLNAPSPAEVLWYRGLIARAFFDSGSGPQEHIFVPDEIHTRLPKFERAHPLSLPGEPTEPPAAFAPALDPADDVTTLLAYAQIVAMANDLPGLLQKHAPNFRRFLRAPEALAFYFQLALDQELLAGAPLKPDQLKARSFLEAEPPTQTQVLAETWHGSAKWNDLLQLPGLRFEGGAWRNDPVAARQAILNLLRDVPASQWWSLDSFVASVKERAPDFQRPAGDYDAWYIRDAHTNDYLRGFDHWERIDGALIRWIIQKPLHWLGLVDLTPPAPLYRPEEHSREREEEVAPPLPPSPERSPSALRRGAAGEVRAFRLTPYGAAFLGQGEWPSLHPEPAKAIQISREGSLRVPASVKAYERFRVARITKWVTLEGDEYVYRLTPSSLKRAVKQGISLARLVAFLEEIAGEGGLAPTLSGALQRWGRSGSEALIKETAVLKVSNPELLQMLQRTPNIGRYLGRKFGPAAVEVRREDVDKLRAVLAELGILSD
jgi:hypothetical protein